MILAGTGHRPHKLGGYGIEVQERLFDLAVNYLNVNRPDKMISGMALGWDMAVAEAAIALKIPLLVALPFEGQQSNWPPTSQRRYNFLVGLADERIVVSEGGYKAWKMIARDKWMVENSDAMLALWNGSGGGTGHTVGYAETMGKPVINLWDEWAKK